MVAGEEVRGSLVLAVGDEAVIVQPVDDASLLRDAGEEFLVGVAVDDDATLGNSFFRRLKPLGRPHAPVSGGLSRAD